MRGKLARGSSGQPFPGPISSPRVLRPRDPFTYETLQPGRATRFGQAVDVSKNTFYQGGRPRTTRKVVVRRLFRSDPYNLLSVSGIRATGATVATFSPEFETQTNNPNAMYDPSVPVPSPTEISPRDLTMEAPGLASRGHQNVVKRTLFNQNQGKRLRRV